MVRVTPCGYQGIVQLGEPEILGMVLPFLLLVVVLLVG